MLSSIAPFSFDLLNNNSLSFSSSFFLNNKEDLKCQKQKIEIDENVAYNHLKERISTGMFTTLPNATNNPAMDAIVRNLFTKEEAEFVSKFPYLPVPIEKLTKKLSKKFKNMTKEDIQNRIEDLLQSFSLFFLLISTIVSNGNTLFRGTYF